MFVEKLKEEDVTQFVTKNLDKKVSSVKFADNAINVYFNNEYSCWMEGLIFTDFEIILLLRGDFDANMLNEKWTAFMQQKFGDEYKQAFNENLRKKYEAEMIK